MRTCWSWRSFSRSLERPHGLTAEGDFPFDGEAPPMGFGALSWSLVRRTSFAQRGVSLIEIMLALGLVATAVLAIISVYTMGLRQSVKAEKVLLATEMAREILESVRELSFDQIPDADVVFDSRNNDPAVNDFPPAPYPSRDALQAEVLVDQVAPQLKSVCVKVYYDVGQSVSFQTYFKPL
jgi:type II secretory pathway pseudopilin PulG